MNTYLVLFTAILYAAGVFASERATTQSERQQRENDVRYVEALENSVRAEYEAVERIRAAMPKGTAVVTMYNSVPEQTDATPCIAASGRDVCKRKPSECLVANNALPFGTLVHIEGIGLCEVVDRMNNRYDGKHFDVHHHSVQKARSFGVQRRTYIVF